MVRVRFRIGFCLAVVATSLIVLGALFTGPIASAADPPANARAIARVMQVQDRNTDRLMAIKGVVGTATGLNAAGQPVVKVFLAKAGIPGIPAKLEGVPVVAELTGVFVALPKPSARPGRNKAPKVTIDSPADGSAFDSGAEITFQGTATDKEDGVLTASLVWISSVDFVIGTGGSFPTTLSDETHTITASVTDSGGATGSASITISVGVAPENPSLWCERPVPIGVSTGHPNITAGTIGCRVKDAQGNVYALSNNHVYADCNNALIEDNVLQPGTYDGGVDPDHAIGTLAAFKPIAFGPRGTNTIDAAIALSSTAELGNATPSDGYGTPSSTTAVAYFGMEVKKYGRTTGKTTGQVSDINATLRVSYGHGWALFTDQKIVTPGDFSAGGDSGSLVVTQVGNNPVGLLFAGSSVSTVCNPIDAVLDLLGKEFVPELTLTIDGD